MDWMGKLKVVYNLGYSIYKENFAKISIEFFTNYPKKIILKLKVYVGIF